MSKVTSFIDTLTEQENVEVLENILSYVDNEGIASALYEEMEADDLDEVLRRIQVKRAAEGEVSGP
jgi:hypothetical protein